MARGRGLITIAREFWLNSVAGSPLLTTRARASVLRAGGIRVGRSVGVSSGQRFIGGRRVEFRDGAYVNHGCLFDGSAPIVLEEDVRVGPQVQFLTSSHEVSTDPRQRAGDHIFGGITVGRGTWIGARSVILPGVSLAPGCVIGAGSVVTADTAPDGLYLGVPARRVKSLPGG